MASQAHRLQLVTKVGSRWEPLPTSHVDFKLGTISGLVDHFSQFAVIVHGFEAIGTSSVFQVNGVTLTTSAEITASLLVLRGLTQIVAISRTNASEPVELTVDGLAPAQQYLIYVDSYANAPLLRMTAPGSGRLQFSHDLTSTHRFWIQRGHSTLSIGDNASCQAAGGNPTSSLEYEIGATIQNTILVTSENYTIKCTASGEIVSPGIVVDPNTGETTGVIGVVLAERGTRIENCLVRDFSIGIIVDGDNSSVVNVRVLGSQVSVECAHISLSARSARNGTENHRNECTERRHRGAAQRRRHNQP